MEWFAIPARILLYARMKRLLVLAGLSASLLLPCSRAQAQDEQYVQIYNLIQEGDALDHGNQPGPGLAKYMDAQSALQKFQTTYPDWNSRVVTFRLTYLASRIAELAGKAPPATPSTVTTNGAPRSATQAVTREPARPNEDLVLLQNQVRQLQADKQLLEAKLKEALSAQPAALDPRELAKAEERIKTLEKENGLLHVTLQQQTKASVREQTGAMESLREQLAEANRRVSEQADLAKTLASEKLALQNKLENPNSAPAKAPEAEADRKALEDAFRKLSEQAQLAAQSSRDKETLEARVKSLEADTQAIVALRAENEILKKQLAESKRPVSAHGTGAEESRQLAEARARIAVLQSDKQVLELEKVALQSRVQAISAPPAPLPVFPEPRSSAESARIKQLERDRADLQKKLDAAQKELYGRKRKGAAAKIEDLTAQLEVLRSRVAIYEAQQVPYTPEELVLFKQGQDTADGSLPKSIPAASVRELPAGTATLVSEARRDFVARNFAQAEEKYLQVLQKDEKNVYTLANLSAIQLESGHLDDAEKHIQQALALSPDDAYSLLIMGQVDFRREKYDEALNALSRAAKLDPQNPEIQNYLGLTLSQKGMRHPAETAFRKALQLDPKYGGAHYNLAVFYISQKPSWPELARWHYNKALETGFPRNADLEKMLEQNKSDEVVK
jgi:tetratricopeptide (TPR) repeat protein